jgi:hypothetical protein
MEKIKPTRKGMLVEEAKRRVDKRGKIHLGINFALKYYVISCMADGTIKMIPTWDDKGVYENVE